jgi:adenylate cyclase
VSRLVAADKDLELVGVAGDLPQLFESSSSCARRGHHRHPDAADRPDEGIQAAAWLREHRPGVGVVVLSQYTAPGYAVALLEHGSAGRAYLLKERVSQRGRAGRAITVAQGRLGDRSAGGGRAGPVALAPGGLSAWTR